MNAQIAATDRSAEVRTRRSKLKREIKDGDVLVSELLRKTAGGVPDWLENFGIAQLLSAMPRVSLEMGCTLCESLGIPSLKTVGKMTYRQRRLVSDRVAEWEATSAPNGRRALEKRVGRFATGHRKPGPFVQLGRVA